MLAIQIFDTIMFLSLTVLGFCFTWVFIGAAIHSKDIFRKNYLAYCIICSALFMAYGITGLLCTWNLL